MTRAPEIDPGTGAVVVLASGSKGNASVLLTPPSRTSNTTTAREGRPRATLIDAGLSPRRTFRLLGETGIALDQLDHIVLTHADRDHFHEGWKAALSRRVGEFRATLHAHRAHARLLGSVMTRRFGVNVFEDEIVTPEWQARVCVQPHDRDGVCVFRFELAGPNEHNASLGWATDVGRPGDDLVAHLHGVDVLAIESNYDPDLQLGSGRPWALKRRIMGGGGHLSNAQCASVVDRVEPGSHAILLHLSEQCNRPELARDGHAGRGYETVVSRQTRATAWIPVRPCTGTTRCAAPVRIETLPLFGDHAPTSGPGR